MRNTTMACGSICLAAFLSACGGSDDTPPDTPSPPPPTFVGCPAPFPPIPEGQTYAVHRMLDQIDEHTYARKARISRVFIAGTDAPADQTSLYLTPLDINSPVTQMRAQMTELVNCSELAIKTLTTTTRMHGHATIESLIPNALPPAEGPAPLSLYVLDVIEYWASAPSRVEFVVDPARYAGGVLDAQALRICSVRYNFSMHPTSCPDTFVHEEGQQLVASAVVSERDFSHVLLVYPQPRGVDVEIP